MRPLPSHTLAGSAGLRVSIRRSDKRSPAVPRRSGRGKGSTIGGTSNGAGSCSSQRLAASRGSARAQRRGAASRSATVSATRPMPWWWLMWVATRVKAFGGISGMGGISGISVNGSNADNADNAANGWPAPRRGWLATWPATGPAARPAGVAASSGACSGWRAAVKSSASIKPLPSRAPSDCNRRRLSVASTGRTIVASSVA